MKLISSPNQVQNEINAKFHELKSNIEGGDGFVMLSSKMLVKSDGMSLLL